MNLFGVNFTNTASVITSPTELVSVNGVSKLALVTYPELSVFVCANETTQLASRKATIIFISEFIFTSPESLLILRPQKILSRKS
jgi:hypothetical protein